MYQKLLKIARDGLIWTSFIGIVTTVIISIGAFIFKDKLEPFTELPVKIEAIEQQLSNISSPELIVFKGHGIIINKKEIKAGESIVVGYLLSRKASCDTDIEVIFMDINTKEQIYYKTIPLLKSPVSEDFVFFPISIKTPSDLPPGNYVFAPRFKPSECGLYKEFLPPLSDVFTVN